jgi:hypothetical protein
MMRVSRTAYRQEQRASRRCDRRTSWPGSKPPSTRTTWSPTRAGRAVKVGPKLGVAELVDEHLKLPADAVGRANDGTKAMTVIGAMLAGGDSISDVDVLRALAGPELFDQGRAPSTIGTRLRGFIWASVRMLDEVSRQMLALAWQAGLGPELASDLTVDFDSTICQVYGTGKQGARFGDTKVRGYHPLLATLASTGEVLHARMRGGNAGAARGAGSFVRETIGRIRHAGATGKLTFRADSAFYSRAFVTACQDHGVAFSVTVDKNSAIRRAIAAIDDDAWVPIPYWLDGGADVAETTYTAFKKTQDRVTLRLIVCRAPGHLYDPVDQAFEDLDAERGGQ